MPTWGVQGLSYEPGELIVTCGATEALAATLMSLLDPGDEVIVPTPAFGLYETIVRAAHGSVRSLDTSASGFQIAADALEAAIGPRTKAIVITSPNNPTGCVYDRSSLDAVAGAQTRHGLFVVATTSTTASPTPGATSGLRRCTPKAATTPSWSTRSPSPGP